MPVQFAVLASGSRGNAALVRDGCAGTLIDVGLGPREMSARLASVGSDWGHLAAVLLTHTHGDHVKDASLRWMARQKVCLYAHEGHCANLASRPGFQALERAGLARRFDDRPFLTPGGMRVESTALRHDGGPTFGFRVEARAGARKGRPVTVGYMADTGCWSDANADALADVDVLGVEFNHDVPMQLRSGRAPYLIARNLGDRGHLSNAQGAGLLEAVLGRSRRGAVRHAVLLHLSEQCNAPRLAVGAARGAVRGSGRKVAIHAAAQAVASPNLWLEPSRGRRVAAAAAVSGADAGDDLPDWLASWGMADAGAEAGAEGA